MLSCEGLINIYQSNPCLLRALVNGQAQTDNRNSEENKKEKIILNTNGIARTVAGLRNRI
jgi:hypothetical protein